jgi:hypothetical protein
MTSPPSQPSPTPFSGSNDLRRPAIRTASAKVHTGDQSAPLSLQLDARAISSLFAPSTRMRRQTAKKVSAS